MDLTHTRPHTAGFVDQNEWDKKLDKTQKDNSATRHYWGMCRVHQYLWGRAQLVGLTWESTTSIPTSSTLYISWHRPIILTFVSKRCGPLVMVDSISIYVIYTMSETNLILIQIHLFISMGARVTWQEHYWYKYCSSSSFPIWNTWITCKNWPSQTIELSYIFSVCDIGWCVFFFWYYMHTGIWNDRGRTSAIDVFGVCKGAIRNKIRLMWNSCEKCRAENSRPRNRVLSPTQSSWRDLHQRISDHERYNTNHTLLCGPLGIKIQICCFWLFFLF